MSDRDETLTRPSIWAGAFALSLLALACGPGSPGGPTLGRSMSEAPPHPLQSNDIMAREMVSARAKVKHILIGWRELAGAYQGDMDPRAQARGRWDAEALVAKLYDRAAAGEDFDALMREYSEDPGSAKTGTSYEVFAGSSHVFEFRRMGIRLQVGEVGKVLTVFGWHIMKRLE
jgi:hypothetical protein